MSDAVPEPDLTGKYHLLVIAAGIPASVYDGRDHCALILQQTAPRQPFLYLTEDAKRVVCGTYLPLTTGR